MKRLPKMVQIAFAFFCSSIVYPYLNCISLYIKSFVCSRIIVEDRINIMRWLDGINRHETICKKLAIFLCSIKEWRNKHEKIKGENIKDEKIKIRCDTFPRNTSSSTKIYWNRIRTIKDTLNTIVAKKMIQYLFKYFYSQ